MIKPFWRSKDILSAAVNGGCESRQSGSMSLPSDLFRIGLLADADNPERKKHVSSGKLLLRRRQTGGHGITGGDGLLSLQFLPFLVRRARERLQPLEAGGGTDRGRSRAYCDISEDRVEPAQILREMRRPPDDQSSADQPHRCLRVDDPDA